MGYKDVVRDLVHRHCTSTVVAIEAWGNLQNGDYEIGGNELSPYFNQSWSRDPDPVVGGWLFAQIWAWLRLKKLLCIGVSIAEPPPADKETDRMNALLATMPTPFSGNFVGGTQIGDGTIFWDPEHPLSPNASSPELWTRGNVPLEVGYCDIETIWYQLAKYGSIARWPYGKNEILIFAFTKEAKKGALQL